jgi:hypothetical protein
MVRKRFNAKAASDIIERTTVALSYIKGKQLNKTLSKANNPKQLTEKSLQRQQKSTHNAPRN